MEIIAESPAQACVTVLQSLTEHSHLVSPRHMPTWEQVGVTILVQRPWMIPFSLEGRALSSFVAAVETAQLLGQTAADSRVAEHAGLAQYRDKGILEGAYGPRVRGQLRQVEKLFGLDKDTRQAVISIYDGPADLPRLSRDTPCTVALQFLVRDNALITITTMRSNDAYLGLPYDLHQFCALHCAMSQILQVSCGPYMHQVGSMHLYQRDSDNALRVREPMDEDTAYRPLFSMDSLEYITMFAQDCLVRTIDDQVDLTAYERWMMETLS